MVLFRKREEDAEPVEAKEAISRAARNADAYRNLFATPSVLLGAGLFALSGMAGGALVLGQAERGAAVERASVSVDVAQGDLASSPSEETTPVVVAETSAPENDVPSFSAVAPLDLPPVLLDEADETADAGDADTVLSSTSIDEASARVRREVDSTRPTMTAEQAAICRDNLGTAAARLTVSFSEGSTNASSEDMEEAFSFAERVSVCQGLRVLVSGHSDSQGDETENLILSWERAESVIEALAAAGHDTSVYEPVGYGARRLLVSDADDEAADAQNRRVEFAVVEQR